MLTYIIQLGNFKTLVCTTIYKIEMSQLLGSKVEEALQSLIKTAELTAEYGDDEIKNPEPFGQIAEGLLNVKNDMKRAIKAADTAKDKPTIAEYNQTYTEVLKQAANSKVKNTDEYKRFMEEIRAILSINMDSVASTSVVEDEDFLMQIEVSDLDPLTKRRMTHPIKNTICGHYYEKTTILESITVNPRLRCPVAGCGNNQFVKKQHLVEDPVFRMKLQRANQQN